jgi:hypothetical protein
VGAGTSSFASIEELTIAIGGDAVDALVEAGWDLPVHAAAVSADGSLSFVRFEIAGRPPRALAAGSPRQALVSPVTLLLTSRSGRVATVIVVGDAAGDITVLR